MIDLVSLILYIFFSFFVLQCPSFFQDTICAIRQIYVQKYLLRAHIQQLMDWLVQLRNLKFVYTYNGQLCVVDYEEEFQAISVIVFHFTKYMCPIF